MTRRIYKLMSLILLLLSVTLGTIFTVAYFSQNEEIDTDREVGLVDVEIIAYYERGEEKQIIDLEATFGVIELNISDPTKLDHFDNLRVDIKINSNIDTYYRLSIYEQFTLSYETGGVLTKIALTQENYAPFNFNNDLYYDNRLKDDFIYFKGKTKNSGNETVHNLIKKYDDEFPIYESKYTILLGFVIEAVQSHRGPLENWGLLILLGMKIATGR